jgi:hypothetical protein
MVSPDLRLYLPRLAVPVFIGSRLTSLIDPPEDDHPDPIKFWINLISIFGTIGISAATGVLIYRLTLEQMRKLEEGELAASALEEGGLGEYRDGEYRDEGEYGMEEEELEDEPLTRRDESRSLRVGRGKVVRRTSSGSSGST